jgi:hypothetical protein
VELPSHALLFAEGVLAESFVDNIGISSFVNSAERPATDRIAEMPYPRVKSARQLPRMLRAA